MQYVASIRRVQDQVAAIPVSVKEHSSGKEKRIGISAVGAPDRRLESSFRGLVAGHGLADNIDTGREALRELAKYCGCLVQH